MLYNQWDMEISLTQGKVAIIDDVDWPLVAPYKWYADKKPRLREQWYAAAKIKGKRVRLHKFLTGWPMTDHRDGDGLNNRRSNLRPCDTQQNQFNCGKCAGSTSQFKGVCVTPYGHWRASIRKDYKLRDLGTYKTEEDAARAYDAAASELFGEFARLNFPPTTTSESEFPAERNQPTPPLHTQHS